MNSFQSEISRKYPIIDILFLIYVITLVILLIMPTDGSIKLNLYFFGIRTDHFIHASLFLPFLPYFRLKQKTKINFREFLKFYMLGIAFAISCETIQMLVPYRSFDPTDIVANVIGISLGGIAFIFQSNLKSKTRN